VIIAIPPMKAMAQKTWARGEPLTMLDLPTPEPGASEVRVQVKAIGVNPVDWKMRNRGPLRLAARLTGPSLPFVPGVDFAGIVDAVGKKVRGVKPGDRVVGGTNFARGQRGSYADTVIVQEDQLALVPDHLDLTIAGALPVAGVTAWMCIVEMGKFQAGRKALVLGASGGVGQLAVQFVKHLGGIAVGVCSGKNVALVRDLGADEVLDYNQGDPLEQARGLGPFQIILDCAGGYSPARCRSLLEPGGRHLMISSESPGETLQAFLPPFSSKLVLGKPTRERLQPVVEAVASGAVKVHISETLPLAEAERAHTLSQGGRLTGKLVLVP
jgi:NADPH:quinone reductase-like Zn-dependent oxidoreductase